MPQTSDTALFILDLQVGIGDQPYAKSASLHEELMTKLFPRSAEVLTVDQLITLPGKGKRKHRLQLGAREGGSGCCLYSLCHGCVDANHGTSPQLC
jgi:hypothetical protein